MSTIKFNVDDVLPCIAQCAGVISSKGVVSILSTIMFESFDDNQRKSLCVTASDGQTWVHVKAELIDADADVRFCIDASDFMRALGNLKGEEVAVSVDADHSITCKYKNGSFTLPYLDADVYPAAVAFSDDDVCHECIVSGDRLLNAINATSTTTSEDALRPILNGIHFDFLEDSMVCVSTDTHKLSKLQDSTIKSAENLYNFTLPKAPALVLITLLRQYSGGVRIKSSENSAEFSSAMFKVSTRLLPSKYPNYNSVIPSNNDIVTTIDKDALVGALKRVQPLSNPTTQIVTLEITADNMLITSEDTDFGKRAHERVECVTTGGDIKIGFKGTDMVSILQGMNCEKVKICLKEPSRAGVFIPCDENENVNFISLLMPLLVS